MKNKLILFVLAATLLVWYQLTKVEDKFELPIFTPADLRPTLVHPSLIGKTTHEIPNFSFTNQFGDKVSNEDVQDKLYVCLLYTSPSPRDLSTSRMPSSA